MSNFTATTKTITFTNGNTFPVVSKETKSGVRFYYRSGMRHLPVSKKDIK